MKSLKPLFFFMALISLVGLACSALGGAGTAPSQVPLSTQPVEIVATNPPPQPTEVPPTEEPPPTEPPAPQAQPFFTEEFETPLSSDWSVFTVTDPNLSDLDNVKVETQDGKLIWDLKSEYVYYYLFYGAFDYEDVQLDTRADNRGKNNNSVSLICRYDPNAGWYEFNIANNGLYNILYAEILKNGKIQYHRIANGGSKAIKIGKEVNEYSITCKGSDLTLHVNGDEVISITEKKYALRSGQVGISVSSENVLPILIEMDWLKISEP